jgi:murein DD-endopeptidase MepM/ murein hydrolase activator NlpD
VALQLKGRARRQVLLIVALLLAGYAVLLWFHVRPSVSVNSNRAEQAAASDSQATRSTATVSVTPTSIQSPQSLDTPGGPGASGETLRTGELPAMSGLIIPRLIIPVVGVRPDQLADTFSDSRSEGRVHDAIDIRAPAGTAVLAAADGEIVKLTQSERGGTTIYQLSGDKKLVFYYAHLQRYADGLVVGKIAKQGEVIGFVGDTGNAGAGNFHLHFSIAVVSDPKRYWEGANINPYPLLYK